MPNIPLPDSIDATLAVLAKSGYIGDRPLATVLYLALRMGRPLFLEGEAGTGKTEIAKVLAESLGRRLIRLQCYEGLDVAAAVDQFGRIDVLINNAGLFYAGYFEEISPATRSGHKAEAQQEARPPQS